MDFSVQGVTIVRMIIRALVSVAALAGLALIGSTPALASQPYPLNYKTFSLGAADATLVGTSFSGGALKLASNGLGTFAGSGFPRG